MPALDAPVRSGVEGNAETQAWRESAGLSGRTRREKTGVRMNASRWLRNRSIVLLLAAATALVAARQGAGQATDEQRLMAAMHSISAVSLFDYVKELASPKYEGRLTGTPGYVAAEKWAEQRLAQWKIKPAGDGGTYEQRFPNPYTLVKPGARLSLHVPLASDVAPGKAKASPYGSGSGKAKASPYPRGEDSPEIVKTYVYEDEFYPGSTSDSGTVTAEVVYVGYGITAPELGYDDYQGVDVKGKLVMMEPEVPVTPDNPDEFRKWRPYSFHDYKTRNASHHGAAGMLYDYHIVNPNCVFIRNLLLTYVGDAVVSDVFAGTGRTHEAVVEDIRQTRKPASFETKKVMTVTNVTEHHPEGVGSNVVGVLEGSDAALKDQAIVIGAHLDHLGLNDRLMPGANDNASGDAILLGVARAVAESGIPLKRTVVFILFGAEEQGVKGSEYYVAHAVVPSASTTLMVNLESVGHGDRISASGGGGNVAPAWSSFEQANAKYVHQTIGLKQAPNLARPRQDAAHFMWANVPTLNIGASGGARLPVSTYHTSHDVPEFVDPGILEDAARLVFLAVVDIANK